VPELGTVLHSPGGSQICTTNEHQGAEVLPAQEPSKTDNKKVVCQCLKTLITGQSGTRIDVEQKDKQTEPDITEDAYKRGTLSISTKGINGTRDEMPGALCNYGKQKAQV
jgi:hypothetical protein